MMTLPSASFPLTVTTIPLFGVPIVTLVGLSAMASEATTPLKVTLTVLA
jgi:hypothetical protein